MNKLLEERENYLNKKLSHLLFEILEYPEKKDVLYIGLCYCQLSRVYSADEIPLSELRRCLTRYLIDFESYPWRDYLLELELFYLRDTEETLIKGAGLITYTPTEETTLNIDPKYGFLKQQFCQKIYRYWYISQRWGNFKKPLTAQEVIENAVRMYNEGLYNESLHYTEDYLPYFKSGKELLLYRIVRGLSHIGLLVERKEFQEASQEIKKLKAFLKEFSKELKSLPYDFKKLHRELSKLEKTIVKGKGKIYIEPVRFRKKKGKGFWRKLIDFLKGFGVSR